MCGIAGYKAFGSKLPNKTEVGSILLGIEERGKEATGVAFINKDGNMRIIKGNMSAHKFIKSQEWSQITDMPKVMIMHTRRSTKGEPENNMNNHPIFSKNGTAIVHNGVINNDDELFTQLSLPRDAEVDSEIILRLLDDGWWDNVENINLLHGIFSVAALSKNNPDELILIRKNEPLQLYMDVDKDILFFASTKDALQNGLNEYHRGFQTHVIESHSLNDDYAIRITKDGLTDDFEIKTIYKYQQSYQYQSYSNSWYKEWIERNRGMETERFLSS